MSKNEELIATLRDVRHTPPCVQCSSAMARAADVLEAQDARIEALEAELASLEENRHVAAQLSHQYRNRAERAEQERDAAVKELRDRELHHFEEEQKSAGLAAVIEAAKIAIGTENAWDGHARADQLDNTRRILVTADTFNLSAYTTRIREEAWEQGRIAGGKRVLEIRSSIAAGEPIPPEPVNPYSEEPNRG